jgi:DUF4097 and DUF4098 domain-containing protein YvlB
MRRRLLFLPLAVLSLILTGCDLEEHGNSNRFREDFSYSFPLKEGGRIDLDNFNGSVEITGWDRETVDITGQKYASTEDLLQAIKIDIVPSPDSVRIRTVRPVERRGNMGARYILRVPRRVVLDRIMSSNGGIRVNGIEGDARLRSSNGSINISDLRGALEANTSNAGIEIRQLEGSANLRTSNGSIRVDRVRGAFEAVTSNAGIEARLTEIDPARPIRVETSNGNINVTLEQMRGHELRATSSNGSITIRLPESTAAAVRARTSNSSITSDFDVLVKGGLKSKTRLEGTIGDGAGLLDIGTSNGSIRLLRL